MSQASISQSFHLLLENGIIDRRRWRVDFKDCGSKQDIGICQRATLCLAGDKDVSLAHRNGRNSCGNVLACKVCVSTCS